jgi:exodeoxyribonuclease X
MTDWTDYRYAVIDTEGNGRQPPDLVELGIVPITSGVIGDPGTWLFKPAAPIMPIARRIHGITNEMVAAAPDFAELAATVRTRLDGAVLVAARLLVYLATQAQRTPMSFEDLRDGPQTATDALF